MNIKEDLKPGVNFILHSSKNRFVSLKIEPGIFHIIQVESHESGTEQEFFFYRIESQRHDNKIHSMRDWIIADLLELKLIEIYNSPIK